MELNLLYKLPKCAGTKSPSLKRKVHLKRADADLKEGYSKRASKAEQDIKGNKVYDKEEAEALLNLLQASVQNHRFN